MQIKIERKKCPNFSQSVTDCAYCLENSLTFPDAGKPLCFSVIEDSGEEELVITIVPTAEDTPVLVPVAAGVELQPHHYISRTDWLS